jgi:hypothetical protein
LKPVHSSEPLARLTKAIGLLLAFMLSQGFYCGEKHDPPSLPSAVFKDIHLTIKDASQRTQGIYLAWDYPADDKASFFEIYQSLDKDSLKHAVHTQAARDSHQVVLSLPDSSRPFTLYFAVRAIWVEPTGQKIVGDTLLIDSLTVTPSLAILQPASGSFKEGRTLFMEVQTRSDPGVMIRYTYFEEDEGVWPIKQEGCLPRDLSPTSSPDHCPTTLFGNTVERDSLTLEQHPSTDTVKALFCVVGTESFQERSTGQIQSLGCTHFFRVGP